jgi:hypothetical protein
MAVPNCDGLLRKMKTHAFPRMKLLTNQLMNLINLDEYQRGQAC